MSLPIVVVSDTGNVPVSGKGVKIDRVWDALVLVSNPNERTNLPEKLNIPHLSTGKVKNSIPIA
jgi:hypothetical protein